MDGPRLSPANDVNARRYLLAGYHLDYRCDLLRLWRARYWAGPTPAAPGGALTRGGSRPGPGRAAARVGTPGRPRTRRHQARPVGPPWRGRRRRRYWARVWAEVTAPVRGPRWRSRRTPARRPRRFRSASRRRGVGVGARLRPGHRGYHPTGRPRPRRPPRGYAVTLSAVVNNFWGKLHHPGSATTLALVSAGHFPGTGGSRRGTPYAAAAVARWAGAGLARQLPPPRRRPRTVWWRPRSRRRRRRGRRAQRQRWRPRWRWTPTGWTRKRRPPRVATVRVHLNRWVRGRRWRTALLGLYRTLIEAAPNLRFRAVHTARVVRPHNGVRPPKARRV